MRVGAAISEHPVTADAVGELLGALLEHGTEPDLLAVFASRHHLRLVGEITKAIRAVVRPRALIGAGSAAVLGAGRDVEDGPALTALAVWCEPVEVVRLGAEDPRGPTALPEGATLLALADGGTVRVGRLVNGLRNRRPDLTVVGGELAAADTRHGVRLWIDGDRYEDGGLALVFRADQVRGAVVAQGARPVGEPMVVTGTRPGFIEGLAGQPAMDRLRSLTRSLEDDERGLLAHGLHLGVVVDESKVDFGPGDFVVRRVLGTSKTKDAVAVGATVPVGTTVQFQLVDPVSANQSLDATLAGHTAAGALLFRDATRDAGFFGIDHHDPTVAGERLGTTALAGLAVARAIGPIAGKSHLHRAATSMLLL